MSEEKSPTKRVRELLDGRGIEYRHQDGTYCSTTTWQSMFGEVMFAEREGRPSTLVLPQFIEGVTPEQAIAATVGRSCASCHEMDNPDSYISHLQSALKWHDEHVPRPTNPHATVVVLRGTRPPDEVLFVREDGEVMHYLPERTCPENAKLRELVRHLYEYRQLYFNTGIYPTDHGVAEQRMRELGIEVDE